MDPHRNQHQLRRRKLHILRFALRTKLSHFAASPLQIKPASLGFNLVGYILTDLSVKINMIQFSLKEIVVTRTRVELVFAA